MKNKGENFIIPLVMIPFSVMVSIDQTDAELFRVLNKKYGMPVEEFNVLKMPESTRGRCVIHGATGRTVIRIKQQPEKHMTIGTVAHECFHAISYIYDRIGIKFDTEISEEAYTYGQQYLVEEIFKRSKLL